VLHQVLEVNVTFERRDMNIKHQHIASHHPLKQHTFLSAWQSFYHFLLAYLKLEEKSLLNNFFGISKALAHISSVVRSILALAWLFRSNCP
jgi:hypothetical protein